MKKNYFNLRMNLTFHGVDGFEEYRPIVHSLVGKVGDQMNQFIYAINEAICNALCYGDGGFEVSKVKVRIRCNSKFIIAKVSSSSPGFDVHTYINNLGNDYPDWCKALRKKNRGRGIWIMLTGSEKVIFNSNGNDVILVSRISAECPDSEERELLSKIAIRK